MANEKEIENKLKEVVNEVEKNSFLQCKYITNQEQYPDHMDIDLGGPGKRGKIYFNSDDPVKAVERLRNYFSIAEAKDKLKEEYKLKSSEADPDGKD